MLEFNNMNEVTVFVVWENGTGNSLASFFKTEDADTFITKSKKDLICVITIYNEF